MDFGYLTGWIYALHKKNLPGGNPRMWSINLSRGASCGLVSERMLKALAKFMTSWLPVLTMRVHLHEWIMHKIEKITSANFLLEANHTLSLKIKIALVVQFHQTNMATIINNCQENLWSGRAWVWLLAFVPFSCSIFSLHGFWFV